MRANFYTRNILCLPFLFLDYPILLLLVLSKINYGIVLWFCVYLVDLLLDFCQFLENFTSLLQFFFFLSFLSSLPFLVTTGTTGKIPSKHCMWMLPKAKTITKILSFSVKILHLVHINIFTELPLVYISTSILDVQP